MKDKEDAQKVKKLIKDTMNRFDKSTNLDAVFIIRTGRKLKNWRRDIFNDVCKRRCYVSDKYIEECQNNLYRFEEAITKQKISNFATEKKRISQIKQQ